jgi:hypothetical protein
MNFSRKNERELYEKYSLEITNLLFKKVKIEDIYKQFPVLDYAIIEEILKGLV